MGSLESLDPLNRAFSEICCRRSGLFIALAFDVVEFVALCDPDKDCMLCVSPYKAAWELIFPPPDANVPSPDHPELTPGVKFKLNGTVPLREWILQIALQSYSWWRSLSYRLAAQLDSDDREFLLAMVNQLPTVYDAVAQSSSIVLDGGNKSKIQPSVRSYLSEKDNETVTHIQGIILDGGNESKILDETTREGVGVHKQCGNSSGEKENEAVAQDQGILTV